MSEMMQHLTPGYQDAVLERWTPVLEAGEDKLTEQVKLATALVLENTQRDFDKDTTLMESYGGGMGGQTVGGAGGGAFGSYPGGANYGGTGNDARMPTIVIPTVRRIFPELLAHSVVGVQPMNGPVGFAFALRARYGANGGLGGAQVPEQTELGYNMIDSTFTGISGNSVTTPSSAVSYWQSFAGATQPNPYAGTNTYGEDGQAANLAESEWLKIDQDMPTAKLTMEKGIIEARARKLAAHWSLELAEDMMNMHGVNVDAEMVNIISYEIQAEIDRQLLAEMVKGALDVKNSGANAQVSTWSPVSADGRNQLERIGTLYTHILDRANRVAITTRRGAANFAISSPRVCALIERLQTFTFDQAGGNKVDTNNVGVAKVGTLRNGAITLWRDTFAGGDYVLLGYKGANQYDSGIIYCPYIPLQLLRAVGPQDFTPRIGVRTRYGLLNHLFGANLYYSFIKIEGLVDAALAGDNGGRVFSF